MIEVFDKNQLTKELEPIIIKLETLQQMFEHKVYSLEQQISSINYKLQRLERENAQSKTLMVSTPTKTSPFYEQAMREHYSGTSSWDTSAFTIERPTKYYSEGTDGIPIKEFREDTGRYTTQKITDDILEGLNALLNTPPANTTGCAR